MSNETSQAAVGFLTIVEDASYGFFGGYLILNPAGRPVEFHCTAPVKANRAMEILYGNTLRSFLFGEQIAKTLVERSKILPRMLCVDQSCTLCVRPLISIPAILVERAPAGTVSVPEDQIFWKEKQIFHTLPEYVSDIAAVRKNLEDLVIEFDFLEPFDRIREAIAEAQKASG